MRILAEYLSPLEAFPPLLLPGPLRGLRSAVLRPDVESVNSYSGLTLRLMNTFRQYSARSRNGAFEQSVDRLVDLYQLHRARGA